jgi:two-component system, NtrC family, response regulator AtoC
MLKFQSASVHGLLEQPVALSQFINEAPIGILIVDPELKVVLMNRALEALTGFISSEVSGVPCCFVLRTNLCLDGCPVRSLTPQGKSICLESNILNKNREKIPVRVTTSALIGERGRVVGYTKCVEDMRYLQKADDAGGRFSFGKVIGNSPEMQRVFRLLPAIAQTDSSVLITGQTGTGKDFVAEAIHNASQRSRSPFVKVNCGALPESLLESELFGHQKGAFTGAIENKPGRFRLAHNGTLYLTEIGDLPLNLQVKLLSFLDDQIIYPLGGSRGIHVDVRVIAATHRDLEGMTRQGRFREDLLFRLNVIRLQLPPLSQRGEDINMLIDHFLHHFNTRFRKKITSLSPRARKSLLEYSFPGNVRELRNIIEFAVNLSDGDTIRSEHLSTYLKTPRQVRIEMDTNPPIEKKEIVLETSHKNLNLDWAHVEREMIMDALVKTRGNRAKAAKLMGLGRSTLWRKMKNYSIVP